MFYDTSTCPSTVVSITASIEVVSRTDEQFRVNCTSTGGRALNMSVTVPVGYNTTMSSIQAVDDPQGMGDDQFSATSDVIRGRNNGDTFHCKASNGVSPALNMSVVLRG